MSQAAQFQNSKCGNDIMKTGHYCKVMQGLQAKGLDFLQKELDRVSALRSLHRSGERLLTDRQLLKFDHYLHIIQLFIDPPRTKMLGQLGQPKVQRGDMWCRASGVIGAAGVIGALSKIGIRIK